MGPNTSAYCSCSATLNGELFVFGGTGTSQNKQVRCNNQTSADSTVRVLSLSRFLSGISRKSCPVSVGPDKDETELSGLSVSLSADVW